MTPAGRRLVGVALLGGLLLLLGDPFLLTGCTGRNDEPSPPPAEEGSGEEAPGTDGSTPDEGNAGPDLALLLALTGGMDGYVEPCECVEGMLGGLPRRANLFRSLAEEAGVPLVPLEGGDLVDGHGRQARLKLEAVFPILSAEGYRMMVPGEKDLRLGPDRLRRLAGENDVRLLAANLLDDDGERAFGPATWRGPEGLAVVGLLSPSVAPEIEATTDLRVGSPAEHLGPALDAASTDGEPRTVVLVHHGPVDEAVELLEAEPRIGGALATHGGDSVRVVRTGDDRPVVAPGTRGVHVPVAEVRPDGSVGEVRDIPVVDDIPDDPDIVGRIHAYRDRLLREGLVDDLLRERPATGGTYVGSGRCRMCHAEAFRVWEESRHAEAFQALIPRHATGDPECLECHVVGLRYEGGFRGRDETPRLAEVGCESCHGPGSNHVENPAPEYGRMETPAGCVRCHDPENSPEFDFEVYWPEIAH